MSVRARLCLLSLVLVPLVAAAPPREKPAALEAKWARVNWEAEAEPVDTIVMHHTAGRPGMTWKELSDFEGRRLYEPRFASDARDPNVQGLPVQSGHFRIVDGRKVEHFCPYHWIVRSDGTAERLLWDDERGWHSGNWQVNMRSIGIVLDGDFSSAEPPKAMLATCAQLIRAYEVVVGKPLTLLGHTDVKATKCPGTWWARGKDDLGQLVRTAEPYPIEISVP